MELPAVDRKSVTGFLGCVSMLQRLPSSTLLKIAHLVIVKLYGPGEKVICKGEFGGGIYFVWEGMAEVSCSMLAADNEHHFEYQLKKFDHFGHGSVALTQQAEVIALTKLTCLMLGQEHLNLLQTKSIWSAEKASEKKCSLVESILQLEPIEVDIFQGITLPDAPKFGKMFGGQFIGQALAAASKTVGSLQIVHSLHAYFILVGDFDIPTIYQVHRVRDEDSFATRRVEAIQKGLILFTLIASFQKEEDGFDHQEALIPLVPNPDMLLSMEELRERPLIDPRLPRSYRNKDVTETFIPWPIEIRFCEPTPITSINQTKSSPSLKYWFRAKGKLSDDQALHRCVAAYASDLIFAKVSLYPHRQKDLRPISLSLNHSIWFHRSFKADDWLLFVINSPTAYNARGYVSGQMFNRKGELVVSLTQQVLIRKIKTPGSAIKSKI